jgi:hypothetical protein
MPNRQGRAIPEPQPVPTDQLPLRFSFKHIHLESDKFHHSNCCLEYFTKLFESLRRYSTWKVEDFKQENNDEHRHLIWFPDTTEPTGFANVPNIDNEQFGYEVGLQFEVCPDKRGIRWRVHGILIDDTFFIVWLDPNHLLYGPKAAKPAG